MSRLATFELLVSFNDVLAIELGLRELNSWNYNHFSVEFTDMSVPFQLTLESNLRFRIVNLIRTVRVVVLPSLAVRKL